LQQSRISRCATQRQGDTTRKLFCGMYAGQWVSLPKGMTIWARGSLGKEEKGLAGKAGPRQLKASALLKNHGMVKLTWPSVKIFPRARVNILCLSGPRVWGPALPYLKIQPSQSINIFGYSFHIRQPLWNQQSQSKLSLASASWGGLKLRPSLSGPESCPNYILKGYYQAVDCNIEHLSFVIYAVQILNAFSKWHLIEIT